MTNKLVQRLVSNFAMLKAVKEYDGSVSSEFRNQLPNLTKIIDNFKSGKIGFFDMAYEDKEIQQILGAWACFNAFSALYLAFLFYDVKGWGLFCVFVVCFIFMPSASAVINDKRDDDFKPLIPLSFFLLGATGFMVLIDFNVFTLTCLHLA